MMNTKCDNCVGLNEMNEAFDCGDSSCAVVVSIYRVVSKVSGRTGDALHLHVKKIVKELVVEDFWRG